MPHSRNVASYWHPCSTRSESSQNEARDRIQQGVAGLPASPEQPRPAASPGGRRRTAANASEHPAPLSGKTAHRSPPPVTHATPRGNKMIHAACGQIGHAIRDEADSS